MLGVKQVHGQKQILEFDFRRGWRDWEYRDMFPVVQAGPRRDDVLHILMHSASRRSTRATYWEGSWPFIPMARFDWSAAEVAENLHDEISTDAWLDLARAWLQPDSRQL